MKRRRFISGLIGCSVAPAIIANAKTRTRFIEGISAGDPTSDTAVIWARTNKSAQMFLEWSTTNNFEKGFRISGPHVSKHTGHIGKIALSGLPPGQKIFYRVSFGNSRNKIFKTGTSPENRISKLRRLIDAKKIVRIIESHNALTGLIVE